MKITKIPIMVLLGIIIIIVLSGFKPTNFFKPKQMDISANEILMKFLSLSDSRSCVTLNEQIGESIYSTCSVSSDSWYAMIKLTYDPKHPRQPQYIFLIVVGKEGNEYLKIFDDMIDFFGETFDAKVTIQSGGNWKRLDLNNYK